MLWTDAELHFVIGPPIFFEFYARRRLLYPVNRGPFYSLQEFFDAVLHAQLLELQDEAMHRVELEEELLKAVMKAYSNNRGKNIIDPEEAEKLDLLDVSEYGGFGDRTIKLVVPNCGALRKALPQLDLPGLSTMLSHSDISLYNVLADKDGRLMALLDWESVDLESIQLIAPYIHMFKGEDCSSYYNSGNLRWPRISAGGEDEYSDPEGVAWRLMLEDMGDIVNTHLRLTYREKLEALQSPWLQTFSNDGKAISSNSPAECSTHASIKTIRWSG
ncbi:hypothetical protein MMC34_007942 [Xylographa carneopallida]|nr:hypothetical protein [Xylographa carneopallida]